MEYPVVILRIRTNQQRHILHTTVNTDCGPDTRPWQLAGPEQHIFQQPRSTVLTHLYQTALLRPADSRFCLVKRQLFASFVRVHFTDSNSDIAIALFSVKLSGFQ